jgi:pimeloyl-ACP methyl ester carboxylesterase
MQTPAVKDNFKLRRTAVGLRKQVTVLVMSFLSVASFHAIGHALIPKLADQFHLVAPDYPGSGNSDYPSEAQFKPTFANLADVMTNFITTVGLKHFIVGTRRALRSPACIS